MSKEYTYDIDKYTIGVDENGEDGIGMTVAKIENGEIKFLGNCYGENARCIDLLIKENQELKKQLEEINEMIEKCGFVNIEQVMLNYCGLLSQQKEFINYLEDEKNRLARECSHIYEDSLGHTRLVNEDIFDEVNDILQKYKSTIGDDK